MAKREQWEIEQDARTLIDAKVIEGDDKRYKDAVKEIKRQNAAGEAAIKKS